MKSENVPVFYSEFHNNLNWCGGVFKRDFIILPQSIRAGNGYPDAYQRIFSHLFGDIVNLDTINEEQSKISSLIERDIISREALHPDVKVQAELHLTEQEVEFLNEVGVLLNQDYVRKAVTNNLFLPAKSIKVSRLSTA